MTEVVNISLGDKYDVLIGRGTPFGNPYSSKESKFRVLKVSSTEEAIRLYRMWLTTELEIYGWDKPSKEAIKRLRGKRLGCYCRPPEGFQDRLLCHGQVLAELAEED